MVIVFIGMRRCEPPLRHPLLAHSHATPAPLFTGARKAPRAAAARGRVAERWAVPSRAGRFRIQHRTRAMCDRANLPSSEFFAFRMWQKDIIREIASVLLPRCQG
jgi:hypothetical protein